MFEIENDVKYKYIVFDIIQCNKCLDLQNDPFYDTFEILEKFTNGSEDVYHDILEHLKKRDYMSNEGIDMSYLFDDLTEISFEEGFEYVKDMCMCNEAYARTDYNYADTIITYIMYVAYARGYPRLQLEPYNTCHCSIYREEVQEIEKEFAESNHKNKTKEQIEKDYIVLDAWRSFNTQFTRSMQTLFTIHALIYDNKDVKQWWNDLSEHCKNIFKQELQHILDNDLQHEYLPTTKYFDEFIKIFNML